MRKKRQLLTLIIGILILFSISKLGRNKKEPHELGTALTSEHFQDIIDISRRPSLYLQQNLNPNNFGKKTYIVDTPYCKIPNIDPFHPSIKKLVKILEPARCKWNASIVFQSGLSLRINWTAAGLPPFNNNVKFCTYRPVYRPATLPTHQNFIQYGKESVPFNSSAEVRDEFVRVNCYDKHNNSIYLNFHAFVQNNIRLHGMYKRRLEKHMKEKKPKRYLNVMLVGLDSVSRSSFIRHMVKTRAFFRKDLEAFEMVGYNKIADNTLPNIVSMTLGKFIEEIQWNAHKTFDEYKFIWKQYAESGYRTLYAEDQPRMSIFNHDGMKGFKIPPAEHYYRPMSLAMAKEKGHWTKNNNCFQDRLEAEIVLNYNYDFVHRYKNQAHFSFIFLTGNTHDYQNGPSEIDELCFNFFKRLHDNDLIKNTVIFFFSDHGMRFGSIRETFIGKLEERLPFMHMIVPTWLRNSYPDIFKALYINQMQLSSPFDVYETLQDILVFDRLPKQTNNTGISRGVSWFGKIPVTRSCKSAGILPHWCTCLQQEKLDTKETVVIEGSNQVLTEIKKRLLTYEAICEELSIKQIKGATRIYTADPVVLWSHGSNDITSAGHNLQRKRNESTEYVQVLIETAPGAALFEATVRVELSKTRIHYNVDGDISRINIYGNQSACINDHNLKKFCFCK